MTVRRPGLTLLVLVGVVALWPTLANAQPMFPGAPLNPLNSGAAAARMTSMPSMGGTTYPMIGSLGGSMNGMGNGFGYFPPYYNPFMFSGGLTPSAGYLFGAASVTQANGQYWLQIQQARLQMSYANIAALDVRRKFFEDAVYQREYMAKNYNPDVVRLRVMEANLNRARNNPPLVEIWSGEALNSLLANLIKQQGTGGVGPPVTLADDVLAHINVTGGTGGNIGLLKDEGKLQWPLPLRRREFDEVRSKLEGLLKDGVSKVKFGNPLPGNIAIDFPVELASLNTLLNQAVNTMTPSQFIEAQRYLNQLNAAFKALNDPNASNFFNQKWAAKGKNVRELVKYMADNGLRFAPATQGDEPAYKALQNALSAYDAFLTSTARP